MSEKKYISKVTRDAEEKRISGNRLVFEALEKRVLLSADIGLMLPDADQSQLLDAELYQPEEFIDTVLLESEATPLNTEPTLTIEAPEPVSGTEESEVVPVAGEEPASAELIYAAEQSIAAPVKEIVFVDSTVDGYEELLQSLFAADEEQDPEEASSAEQYLLSEIQQKASAAPTENQTKAPKTALPQQISTDQQARQLRSNIEIYLLNPNADGVTQITDVLSGYEGLAAVHLISHGSTGTLRIGNSQLSTASLTKYSERLKAWGQSMASGADILLYGCNVAEGETGVTFVKNLAYLTGADVAASDDETGAGLAGGDWLLEASTGVIEAQFNAATDYEHLLASKNIDGTANKDTFTFSADKVTGANTDSDKPTPASVTYTSSDTVQITGAGEDDTFKFTAIPSAGAITLDGGTGSDTLDFSSIDKELFFTVKGSKGNVTVEYKDGSEFKLLLTAKNVEEIIGGTLGDTFLLAKKATLEGGIQGMGGDDTIIFSAGAKIGGKLDGGAGGNNTLAYSYHNENDRPDVKVALDKKFFSSDDGGYKTTVKVDLKKNSATGIYSGKVDGIDNISTVIGGRSNSIVTGSDQGDTVITKAGDNQLEGGQGDDTFDSTLNSSLDVFIFGDDWGSDFITNTTGHKDLLYLSEVTKNLTIDVKENAVTVTSEDGSTVHGNSAKTAGVTGIDKIIGGAGDNTYLFSDKWNSNTVIDDTKAGLTGTLDLSAVTHDLVFRIIGPGTVLVSAAVTEGGVVSEYKVTATGIANITGGLGNNQYKFEGDGSIAGKLIGGAAAQDAGQVNLLDYSSYGQEILLNLTNTAVEFSDAAPVITKDKDSVGNVVNGVLPKQESWTYTVAGLKGTLTLDKT
ncbi:MAG: DUF4347 domain-containing protein, partial [Pseudomonadales bacterium]|nr:DUF4347 domain-containing protein [Pseudomonadales bacterium]